MDRGNAEKQRCAVMAGHARMKASTAAKTRSANAARSVVPAAAPRIVVAIVSTLLVIIIIPTTDYRLPAIALLAV